MNDLNRHEYKFIFDLFNLVLILSADQIMVHPRIALVALPIEASPLISHLQIISSFDIIHHSYTLDKVHIHRRRHTYTYASTDTDTHTDTDTDAELFMKPAEAGT